MIPRSLFDSIKKRQEESNKIIVIYGPRQVGKTTLVKKILASLDVKIMEVNADETKYIDVLSSRDLDQLKLLVAGYDLLFIDEAQRIPDIGINLKILHDQLPELKIIVTGSSSFELAAKTQESLAGRTWTYNLFPISVSELSYDNNRFELQQLLETQLTYGLYPEVFSYANREDKIHYLNEIVNAYLYKDILEISDIRNPDKLRDLLKLLAFQVGSLVSMNELGASLGMSKDTVEKYIDLLEKSFVVFRLSGYSRNLRKEITKMGKIYFYDLGIRNAIIDNFQPITFRNDTGAIWENFLMIERKKKMAYDFTHHAGYFWRTYTGAEIDYIEEKGGTISAFEFKYGKKKNREPKTWKETYPDSSYECINQENYLGFIL